MAKFFIYPFANIGDKTPIPDNTQPDGSVSYQMGFTSDYQLIYGTDPTAKAVPRFGFNELMYDITGAIRQYQTEGFPDFITSAQNGGVPYPYDIYAIVRYNPGTGMQLYISTTSGNTATPPASPWKELTNSLTQTSVVAKVGLAGTQVINHDVPYQPVQYDTVIFDDYSMWQGGGVFNSNFKLPFAGYYKISSYAVLSGASPGVYTSLITKIYQNGNSAGAAGQIYLVPSSNNVGVGGSTVLILAAINDLIETRIFQDNGSTDTLTIGGDVLGTYMTLEYLGVQP